MGESPQVESKQLHNLTTTLADSGYPVRPSMIAGIQTPLVILPIGEVEFSDAHHLEMRHSNHRCDDWRSAMPPLNDECALLSANPEILPVNVEGSM